ncbi:MAG TPA: phosphatidylglycerophosphatase A, partial [Porticoccaceae bacterium]|nr:phosphatidylglycerophosphatase A [Porticoccaceae bacterium]
MTVNPRFSQLVRSPVLLLAFGFGSGLSPKAPGT